MRQLRGGRSQLTDARVFDATSSEELAYWLDNDAHAMDGEPGRNNHVAATRAAAERLLAAWRALGFLDQTLYANGDNGPAVTWSNAEVLDLIREVRSILLDREPHDSGRAEL